MPNGREEYNRFVEWWDTQTIQWKHHNPLRPYSSNWKNSFAYNLWLEKEGRASEKVEIQPEADLGAAIGGNMPDPQKQQYLDALRLYLKSLVKGGELALEEANRWGAQANTMILQGVWGPQLPAFGQILYGSKYEHKQARGRFGLGGKMAFLFGQITTSEPLQVVSAPADGDHVFDVVLRQDIEENKPELVKWERRKNREKQHGCILE